VWSRVPAVVVMAIAIVAGACAQPPAATDARGRAGEGADGAVDDTDEGRLAHDTGDAGGDTARDDAQAMQGDWYLDEADGPEPGVLPPPHREITLSIEAGTLAGHAGCNTYRATYTLDGDRIVIGALTGTERTCEPPGVMDAERVYLHALSRVDRAFLEDERLVLKGDDVTLRFLALQLPGVPDVGDSS
jgi:heat shock protein HslJ